MQYAFGGKSHTPSTDICRPSFDNRVFKDNIEPADIKIII